MMKLLDRIPKTTQPYVTSLLHTYNWKHNNRKERAELPEKTEGMVFKNNM
ncbi:MAG: hypothetical protein KatS3mg078_0047 [Deltaproteobacteria bacterium]|nr:MAG: hypothetical protein KatS3mg078_0047 [Deltaproteobacteria bacterium]